MTYQKEIIDNILKKEVIKEFEQKKLGELIIYFIAQYPDYPYLELPIEKLDSEYLSAYDIPFLASYIRYSDITLLQSGIRSVEIREKLYFLHQQIGTISARYRSFIWSDLISIDDLKRWIPLLKQYWVKERILKNIIITESLKIYFDQCLNPDSYAFQILQMIDKRYPNECVGIFNILEPQNYEPFYKLLKILEWSSEEISVSNLMTCFNENREMLKETPLEELLKNQSPLLIKLRKTYWNINQSENMVGKNLEELKNYFTKCFLGMSNSEFEAIFPKIPPSENQKYRLLKQLYEARFLTILTPQLYEEFKNVGDFRLDLESIIDGFQAVRNFNLQKSAFSFGPDTEIMTLQDSSFIFITMSLKDYEQKCVKKREKFVDTTIQNDLLFKRNDCMIAFEDVTALSYEGRHCIVRGKELEPKAIIAIDTISFTDINVKKLLGLPIILIDTESYAKRNFKKMNQLLETEDWKSYIERKRMLFELLKDQTWLLLRYFQSEQTLEDVNLLKQSFEMIKNNISQNDNKYYQDLLRQLLELNEEIERQLKTQEKGTISYIKRGEKSE